MISILITIVIGLVIVGVAMYLINTLIPMDAKVKQILNVVISVGVCLVLLFWLLSFFNGGVVRFPR